VIWADRCLEQTAALGILNRAALSGALKAAEQRGLGLSIHRHAAGPRAYTAAQAADLILIPCCLSLIDLDAIRRTAQRHHEGRRDIAPLMRTDSICRWVAIRASTITVAGVHRGRGW